MLWAKPLLAAVRAKPQHAPFTANFMNTSAFQDIVFPDQYLMTVLQQGAIKQHSQRSMMQKSKQTHGISHTHLPFAFNIQAQTSVLPWYIFASGHSVWLDF